jgi:hypothetical protein
MRQLLSVGVILLISGMAAGQVMATSGSAVEWIPVPGVYAVPFAPVITTPSVSLNSPQGLQSATGSVAAMTLSPAETLFAQPMWYTPEVQLQAPAEANPGGRQTAEEGSFRFGSAAFQSSYGAAQLAAGAHISKNPVRTYTNQDVENTNRTNGSVSYKGTTKHLD